MVHENVGYTAATSRGVSLTTSATANLYGSWAQIIAATVQTWELVHIQIGVNSAASRYRVDIGRGAAGQEYAIATGLVFCGENSAEGIGVQYTLPVHVPAGSRIAARVKGNTAAATNVRVSMTGYTRGPTKAPGYAVCECLNNGSMMGVVVDPGAVAHTKSSWVQVVASTNRQYRALMGVIGGNNDIARTTQSYQLFDIGIGTAGGESNILRDFPALAPLGPPETHIMQGFPPLPINIAQGSRLAVRAQGSNVTAGDRALDVTLYGLY